MQRITDRLPGERPAHLIVFLPGAYDGPGDFFVQGFVDEVRARRLAVDIVALDAHLGYFNNSTIAECLVDEVLRTARADGYRSIWLVGISLGGLGALLTADRYGGVDGVVSLAPYVGTRDALAEVRAAGGFDAWRRRRLAGGAGTIGASAARMTEWEASLYEFVADYPRGFADRPRWILAYGRQDRFASSIDMIAEAVAPAPVITTEGGHDWSTWRRLWREVLDRHGHWIAPVSTDAPALDDQGESSTAGRRGPAPSRESGR